MDIILTPLQSKAISFLTDGETRRVLFGGAKGPGKSFLLCQWVHYWSNYLCDLLNLTPSENPVPLGFIGRKQSVDFKKTTLETWKRCIPLRNYVIKEQAGEIILFDGRCKVTFGGLDSQATINKFNSAEYAFFAIDQSEETNREDVAVLRGSLRLKVNGVQPVYKELYTANPADCWLKEDFIDNKTMGYAYIPALPADNPYLPDNYIQTLEEAFKHAQPLLRAYRDGDWSALKSSNTLISSYDLDKLKDIGLLPLKEKRVVVCDPATSHDECVIYYMRNYRVEDELILVGETDEMKIAGHIVTMARKHNTLEIGGDSIGLGAGIFSRVQEMGEFIVTRINSAESSMSPQFINKRAEIFWNLMKAVLDKRVYYPEDEELRRQLINITYEVTGSSGEIKITLKDAIKKVLGRSPDRADCFAYGVWLSDRVEPYTGKSDKKQRYQFEENKDYDFNPATV